MRDVVLPAAGESLLSGRVCRVKDDILIDFNGTVAAIGGTRQRHRV